MWSGYGSLRLRMKLLLHCVSPPTTTRPAAPIDTTPSHCEIKKLGASSVPQRHRQNPQGPQASGNRYRGSRAASTSSTAMRAISTSFRSPSATSTAIERG